MPMAATMSLMPNWRSMRVARSPACALTRSPISGRIRPCSGRACRHISTRCCSQGSTTSRKSIARSTRSTPTPLRLMQCAAPGVRKRRSSSSAWSSSPLARRAAIRWRSAAPISSNRFRIRRRLSFAMTRAITARASTRRWNLPTTRALPSANATRRATASCAASASRPISRPAVSRPRQPSAHSARPSVCGNPPRYGSTQPARSKSSPAATPTARATKRHSRRSFPTVSAFRSKAFRLCTAIPTRCSLAWAPTVHARARSACRRS